MEREQRKLQAVWGKNTEKKNIEMNMEEQVTFKIIGAGTELGLSWAMLKLSFKFELKF